MPTHLRTRNAYATRLGHVDFDGASLAVTSPLLKARLAVPRDVWLGTTPDGDADIPAGQAAICWSVPPAADTHGVTQDWALGGAGSQAFGQFQKLAYEERPERFVAFARLFGVLGLWPYREPTGSKIFGIDYWVPSSAEGILTPCQGIGHALYFRLKAEGKGDEAERLSEARYEPVAEWRRWATWFRAALAIASKLREGRAATREAWQALDWDDWFDPDFTRAATQNMVDVAFQKRELVNVIQRRFLKWSGLVPTVHWGDDGPGMSLALGGKDAVLMPRHSSTVYWPPNTLYPALVAQLVAIISGPTVTAACWLCKRLHPRTRKVRDDQPAYCGDCREVAIRDTKARSAAKRRAEGRLT